MSDRRDWLSIPCPVCGAAANARCGSWHWSRGGQRSWRGCSHLDCGRGWRERKCPKCKTWPGYACVTPSGREAAGIHSARLWPARLEVVGRPAIWGELERRGARIARVPFAGRAGMGGRTERIELLACDGGGLSEVELWSSRDELCFALEAPVWGRFGTFVGHPQIVGEVLWLASERVVEIVGTRGGRAFEERLP